MSVEHVMVALLGLAVLWKLFFGKDMPKDLLDSMRERMDGKTEKKREEDVKEVKQDHADAVNSDIDDWVDEWLTKSPGGVPDNKGRVSDPEDSR